jgi:hypothetical protein
MSNMTPPKVLVFLVRLLLPRICREHVLGDLHERYRSPFGYAADGANAIAAAIVGQIRRATPARFLLLETLVIYASFFAAARSGRGGSPVFYGSPDFSQISCITLLVMAGLLWRDAYALRPTRSSLRLIVILKRAGLKLTPFRLKLFRGLQVGGDVYLAIYFSCAVAWTWQLVFPTSHLFPAIMTLLKGVFFCFVPIGLLRVCIVMSREDYLQHVS